MLATMVRTLPRSDDFVYESKWDGFRAALFIERGVHRLVSRNRTDMTDWFPELVDVSSQVSARTAIVDGEVVCRDGSVDSFNELLEIGRRRGRRADHREISFVAFDVLRINSRDMRALPIEQRRSELARVVAEGNRVVLSRAYDDGQALYDLAIAHGLEGVIGKRKGTIYTNGRSRDWIKFKVPGAAERHDWVNR